MDFVQVLLRKLRFLALVLNRGQKNRELNPSSDSVFEMHVDDEVNRVSRNLRREISRYERVSQCSLDVISFTLADLTKVLHEVLGQTKRNQRIRRTYGVT